MDVDLAVSLNPNNVSPGLLGFLIVCVLGVLVWMLCRNMGKHLTKLDDDYQTRQDAAELLEAAIPAQAAGPARSKAPAAGSAKGKAQAVGSAKGKAPAARKPRPGGDGKAGAS
jgi:hypothetical protein